MPPPATRRSAKAQPEHLFLLRRPKESQSVYSAHELGGQYRQGLASVGDHSCRIVVPSATRVHTEHVDAGEASRQHSPPTRSSPAQRPSQTRLAFGEAASLFRWS